MNTLLLPEFSICPRTDLSGLINRVFNVDALTLLRALPSGSVDAVITDPPYGYGESTFSSDHDTGGHYKSVSQLWDKIAPIDWMAEAARVLKPTGNVIVFGGIESIYKFAGEGMRLGWKLLNDITWFKPDAVPCLTGRFLTPSTERLLWFSPSGKNWTYNLNQAKSMNMGQNLRDMWTFGQTRGERLHPTQKPLELMERCIRLFTNEGDLVVDPFAGSGTTAIAARNLGRRFICGDITPEYVQVARDRLAQPYTPNMFTTLQEASA